MWTVIMLLNHLNFFRKLFVLILLFCKVLLINTSFLKILEEINFVVVIITEHIALEKLFWTSYGL